MTSLTDRILTIIPVRNEATTISQVIQSLQEYQLHQIRVIDNGSSDGSGAIAKAAGAEVIVEPKLGYGQACWRGLQNIPPQIEWILFCDGDGSDDLSQLPEFWQHMLEYDLILGNRRATPSGRKAMTAVQNFGNALATKLINWGWGHNYQDLGPLRLIRRSALERIQMQDRSYGWTVEMQVRALECNLRVCELPVNYHPRQGGRSKISGTIIGSTKAGTIILTTLGKLYLQNLHRQIKANPWLLVSALCLLAGALLTSPYGDFRQAGTVPRFWGGVVVMSLGFMLAWRLKNVPAFWFWGVAILARFILLPMYPESDVWRYLWEGRIQNLGFSPYHLPPIAPELQHLRDELWWQINHRDVSAIYPPLAQLGFRLLAAIDVRLIYFKLAFIAADLWICHLLSRRFGYRRTLLYAWNPLVIYVFAGGAHYDSWFILPLVAAWLVFDYGDKMRRWWVSALLLGISVALKWMSLPILSFLVWQAWRKLSWRSTTIVILCGILPVTLTAIPFCTGGECPLIPTGSVFVSHGRSAELLPYLVSLVWEGSRRANWYYLFPLAIAGLMLLWRAKTWQQFAEGYFSTLLIISPIVHAWYFTWAIPFAVASQNLGIRLVSMSAFVYYVLLERMALGINDWFLLPQERVFLWLPFLGGWLWSMRKNLSSPSENFLL